jgi:hypothetical protein
MPSLNLILQRVEALSIRAEIAILEYLASQAYFTVSPSKDEIWTSVCREQYKKDGPNKTEIYN